MLNLVKEQYKKLVEKLVYKKELETAYYNLAANGYRITQIVPMCAEEFVNLSAHDLIVDMRYKPYTNEIDIDKVESLFSYEMPEGKLKGIQLNTIFQHQVFGNQLFDIHKGQKGASFFASENDPAHYLPEYLQTPNEFSEVFIFKTKGPDFKKVQVDKTTLSYLEIVLDSTLYKTAKKNFKRIHQIRQIRA